MKVVSWSPRFIVGLTVGFALLSTACGTNAGNAMSPSGTAPVSLDHSGGGAHKHFTVSVTPTTVSANQTGVALTVRVTNCGALTGCADGASNQNMGSFQIEVPSAFTVTGVGNPTGDRPWIKSWSSGQVVVVGAPDNAGNAKKLLPGEHIDFTITVTTGSVCQKYDFTNKAASNSTLESGVPTFGADWVFYGTVPSVEINNCSVATDCPAAPSIAAHYLQTIGISPGSSEGHSIVSDVAHEMGPQTNFQGVGACDPAYAQKVKDFVDGLLAEL